MPCTLVNRFKCFRGTHYIQLTLKMERADSFRTVSTYQTTSHLIPDDHVFVFNTNLIQTDKCYRQLEEFQGESTSSLVQNGDAKGQPDGGIRLFASSSSYLSVDAVPSSKKRKRRQVAQEDDEDELEKCRAAAVSPQWIMSGKETAGWEKCGKEVLVVNSNGEVIAHEGAKMKIKTNSWGVRDSTFHIDVKSSAQDLSLKQREKRRQKRKKEKRKIKKLKMEIH
jgi:hypothetical protein